MPLDPAMEQDLDRMLIPEHKIQERVSEMGAQISRDYRGRELLLIGILKGAVLFLADLARHLEVPTSFDFMAISSYGAATRTSGVVRVLKDLEEPIAGRDVLIVEDIVDTGLTLNYLSETLRARNPGSLAVCTLLDKPSRRRVKVEIAYNGFQIPDEFVVGYGLDYQERYRQLRSIYVLKPEVYHPDANDQAAGKAGA